MFKRSGGISKRNKKSPKPKRASFATTTPIEVPTSTSDSSPPPSTDPVAVSSSPPANDRVPTQTEDGSAQGEDDHPPTQGEDVHPPTQEGNDHPPTHEGTEERMSHDELSLDLNDPSGETQR